MAKKNKEVRDFEEFSYDGENFEYTGRVYPAKDGRSFVYLTIDGVFTIQCHLVETEKGKFFISFPSYKNKDGKYKSYIFTDEKMQDELEEHAKEIHEAHC